ncbi:uncharacterized protein LODBEIA_P17190 [Lodderomyces beijingensis]|uniref:SKP1 component POZ domain-containing protein n=1 Tax=Lodderomyces beijingensis TaxID=1775926 RepID=A0ABP0ZH59_9ASCO
MNINRKVLEDADIYAACNGVYREQLQINRKYILENETKHEITRVRKGVKVEIDRDAGDLDKVFQCRGRFVSPDEMLELMKPGHLMIPIEEPKNSKRECKLPSSDLLKAVHYYVASRYTKPGDAENAGVRADRYVESMDETALLSMGLLLDSWMNEFVTEDVCRMYLQKVKEKKKFDAFLNVDEEDIDVSSDEVDDDDDE